MDFQTPEPDDLPEELIHLVKPELQPGERLLWASKAGAGFPLTFSWASWAVIWFFGTASMGVVCLAMVRPPTKEPREASEILLLTIGILSAAAAVLIFFGFLGDGVSRWADRRKAAGQYYALTDRRAVIWVPQGRGVVSVHTFQRGTIKGEDLHRIQHPDGSGDVQFRNAYQSPSGFLGIADVRRVEELVRRFLVDPARKADPVSTEHP